MMKASEQAREEIRRRIADELEAADAAEAHAARATLRAAVLKADPTADPTTVEAATEEAQRATLIAAMRTRDLHRAIEAAVHDLGR
ncbi:hypothetical protein G5C51_01850 [Streptomyces sp. A7024]|uniref:Uncharacterized protein n=1 Tax=Streptomyces coryli TaxID=1128680 RepID=A0A6G4TRK9_9ACTN|nr:hypothetical protein [Streptomyces coryli]NGN62649.1 hypothetical protein [Streptomyces coryli]